MSPTWRVSDRVNTRAQCIVYSGDRLLMVQHRLGGQEWWCLPGGGVEGEETPGQAALRELKEECGVEGTILRETARAWYAGVDASCTFLIDIGDQEVTMGSDPEFGEADQVIADVRWMALSELPERDRAFVWAAGLLSVGGFQAEVENWGNQISYPGTGER